MANIVALSGSPSPSSRTRIVVREIGARIAERSGVPFDFVDIAELTPDLGIASRDAASARLERALKLVEKASLIVAGSPVYKGSYTGLFKHFIDLLEYPALFNVPVALVATGGSERHALTVEHSLRPLFSVFCAHTLPTAVFIPDRALAGSWVQDELLASRLDQMIREAVEALARQQAAAALPAQL